MLGLLKRIRNHNRAQFTAVESIADLGDKAGTAYLSVAVGIITIIAAVSVFDCLVRSLAMTCVGGKKLTKRRKTPKNIVCRNGWFVPMKLLPVGVNNQPMHKIRISGRQNVWTGRNYKKIH